MDKAYKSLLKKEKSLEKATKKVIKADKGRDKKFDREEKMVKMKKGKC